MIAVTSPVTKHHSDGNFQANQATPAFSIVAEPRSPLTSNRDFKKLEYSEQLLTIYEEQSEPSSWQRKVTLM